MAHHVDSPCANIKQNKWPRLPILTAEMESSSDESEENCGYDPDSESEYQVNESSRVLKSKYLDSPETLREAPACEQSPKLSPPPTFKSRIKAPSVVNLEQLLGNKNSTNVMASTMLDGQQYEDPPDFVPDVSSVDKRGELNHLQITSVLKDTSNGKEETKGEQFTGMDKPEAKNKIESVSFVIPENQKSSFLIKKTSTPGEDKKPKERWEGLSSIHSSEAGGSLLVPRQQREILTDEERDWSSQEIYNSQEILQGTPQTHTSQEILQGTPQSHTLLTSSRKEASAKRVPRTLRSGDTETLVEIQQNETIAKELKDNCNESDDSLIIIEDGDSPISTATSKLKESIKLCEFPIGQPGAVIVAMRDYATLDSETFVNDIIIDFYIKFLQHNVLPSADQSSVQIFSTMFYKRLMQSPKKESKKIAFFETDPTLTVDEKRHYCVAGWTKTIDLFNMKMIIVPICESAHWFLLIIVNPGALVDLTDSEGKTLGVPCIIVLDSLGGEQTDAVNNLRGYLAWEWNKRKCLGGETVGEIKFSSEELPAIYPVIPEQQNGVDCGVFLLHYVEKIFQNVLQFLSPNLPDLSTWFTMQEVGQKRTQIAELIRELAEQQNSQKIINYPDINQKETRQLRSIEKPTVIETNDDDDDALKTGNNSMSTENETKQKDFKERSVNANQGDSNIKQNIEQATKKPKKVLESSNLIPNSSETTTSRVKCPSPRMRRQPLHSSGVTEESLTNLNFDLILEESENLEKVATKTRHDVNESALGNESVKNTSQPDLEDNREDEKVPDCSDNKMRLMEALKHSLLLISPERSKIEGSLEITGDSSSLYRSPDLSHKEVRLRDKINHPPPTHYSKRKVTSLSSWSSNGEVSMTDTSADLFTPGRGTFHVVPFPKENDEVKTQPTKKFKLASKVKCRRFNDKKTKAQETFERLMNDESSGEESDVFSPTD